MKQVVLVCGAGASSQFIVQRIRAAAEEPLALTAAALDLMPDDAGTADLLYLGPHLAASATELQRRYPDARIAVMTAEEYADLSGVLTYRRLLRELGPSDHPHPSTPTENPIMVARTVLVRSAHGLHARPAALFTQAVAASGASVTIQKTGGDPVDAASILSVLSQGINHGDEVVLTTADDQEAVLDELVRLLETDHDES